MLAVVLTHIAHQFGLACRHWGAYPSNDPSHIQSGHGFVHNTYLLPRPRKTMMHARWHPVPQPAWWVTHRHSLPALAAATRLNADPDPRILPGLFALALRG
jgi:aldehyde dehydrogenase (NAD(P)+)